MTGQFSGEGGIAHPTPDSNPMIHDLGRPFDPEWAGGFAAALQRVVHPSVRLLMRQVPGVAYAQESEFYQLADNDEQPDTSRDMQADVDDFTETLAAEGKLERDVALAALKTKTIGTMKLVRNPSGFVVISTRVLDVTGNAYSSDPVMATEQQAVAKGLGIYKGQAKPPADGRFPIQRVRLGLMYDPYHKVPVKTVDRAARSVGRDVSLGQIGILTRRAKPGIDPGS